MSQSSTRPAFVKRRGFADESLAAKAAEARKAAKIRKRQYEGRIKPKQAALVAEMMRNGQSLRAASERIGVSYSTAYAWWQKPNVRALYDDFVRQVGQEVRDWGELVGQAQQVLVSLLDAKDDKVRKDVAIYIIDRTLGKVPQKVDATVTRQDDILTEVELQAALSLVAGHGMTLAEASRYVREHREEVAAWAQSRLEAGEQGKLPSRTPQDDAGPIIDAEVVGEDPAE